MDPSLRWDDGEENVVSPAAIYFFVVLATQAFFTVGLMWIVARRFPARVRVYRFVAPAAVPLFLFGIVSISFLSSYSEIRASAHVDFDPKMLRPLLNILLAYGVLWLIGLLLASMVIRWTRR
jgi:hypothetical protein